MPFDNLPSLPSLPSFGFGQQRSALRAPLAPDQREGIDKSLLGQAQGALSYTLDALNKPGRAVRGVLAGKLHEGLAAIPFSDSLGITNPEHEVTGKKLLQHYGVLRPGDKSWGAWGAGLAADVATDPLTYASFGAKHALTGGGRALEAAGQLKGWGRRSLLEGFNGTESAARTAGSSASDIAHSIDQGSRLASPAAESIYQKATGRSLHGGEALSGLARFSIPFKPNMGFTVGTGRASQAVAGGLDAAGDYLKYGNPVGRTINANFSPEVHRGTDAIQHRGWANEGHPVFTQLNRAARGNEYKVGSQLDQLIRANPADEAQILRAARIGGEGSSPRAYLAGGNNPAYLASAQGAGMAARNIHAGQHSAEQAAGLLTNHLSDKYTSYLPRQATSAAESGAQLERNTIFPTHSGANIHREEMFRDIPGGTDYINDAASRLAGSTGRPDIVNIFRDLVADHRQLTGLAPSHADKVPLLAKAKQMSEYFGQLDQSKYLGKVNENPLFSHGLSGDVLRRSEQHARTMGSSSAAISALGQAARPLGSFGAADQFVPATQALKQLGLGNHDTGAGIVGAGKELYRKLAPQGAGNVDQLTHAGVAPGTLDKALGQYGIPKGQFDSLAKQHSNWVVPEEIKGGVNAWDSTTNAFKAMTYPIWLASHVRNAATAGLNNLRTGTSLADYGKQLKLMTGKLPAAEADALRGSQYAHANIFGDTQALELQGTTGRAMHATQRQWQDYTPGTNSHGAGLMGPHGSVLADTANLIGNEGVLQHGRDLASFARHPRTAPNPYAVAGVGQNKIDRFAPVAVGRKVSGNIENFMRGAQYNGLIRQGHTADSAADMINKFHFDYSQHGTTPFERNVMKRAMPFYRFSRGNLPLQLETLATRPGAFSSPFAPTRVDRDQQNYIPDYLAAGFAAPLGKEKDGSQRFLSSLGLPQEEAMKEMSLWNGRPDLTTTAMHYAGNLNPMIKAPLEQIADRQFYSGRKLSDLRPSASASSIAGLLGSDEYAQPLSQLISNTPLTRFATSLDKLVDTKGLNSAGRKPGWATALNLATGARVTDVDLEKQRYLEQRAALDSMLRGSPNVSHYTQHYVRPENKGQLSPDEVVQLRKLTEMQAQGRKYTEQQRRIGVRTQ